MANELRFRASMKDDVSKPIRSIEDAFGRLNKYGKQGVIAGATAAATAKAFSVVGMAISGATDFMKDSAQAASNLAEAQTKVNAVFGDSAAEIHDWSREAADSFGTSQRAALEAAGTYGNLFQAFGVGREEATKMSKSLVELAADLASFNNTSVEDALVALRSGLSGETEPLKRYGIAIQDARMRTILMEQGVKKLGATLTPLQKATAAYEIIMRDSALAQGDFARTAEGAANMSRTLDANIEDLQAKLGGPLSQAATTATGSILKLVDGMQALLDETKPLDQRLTEGIEGTGGFAQSINDLLNPSMALARQHIEDAADALEPMNDRLLDAGHAADIAAPEVEGVGDAAGNSVRPTRDLRREVARLAKTMREDLKDAAEDTADALAEAIFGPAALKGELAGLRSELVEDQAELRKLEAIKDPTAAQRRDITETKGRIAETKSEILRTRVQLALLDGTGLDSVRKELIKLASRTDAAGDEARELLRLLNLVANVRLPTAYGSAGGIGRGGGGGRHGGGLMFAGDSVDVGEHGKRERVHMLGGGMAYVESGGAAARGGGGVVINLSIAPHPMATPGQAQAWAREAAPALADELRRRGLV